MQLPSSSIFTEFKANPQWTEFINSMLTYNSLLTQYFTNLNDIQQLENSEISKHQQAGAICSRQDNLLTLLLEVCASNKGVLNGQTVRLHTDIWGCHLTFSWNKMFLLKVTRSTTLAKISFVTSIPCREINTLFRVGSSVLATSVRTAAQEKLGCRRKHSRSYYSI